jgi:hypothetical protein
VTTSPFDLQAAAEGHTVTSVYKDKVRILCTDAMGPYPVVALITMHHNSNLEILQRFDSKGCTDTCYGRPYLLMAGTTKKE